MPTITGTARRNSNGDDSGTVLILTLILTVVMAVIVLAIATFATTGLTTSKVTTRRTESNIVTSAALTWYIEELSAKRIQPSDASRCDASGVITIVPPGVLGAAGSNATVTCTTVADIGGHPTVELVADGATAEGVDRAIEAVVQVPAVAYTTQIKSWTVD